MQMYMRYTVASLSLVTLFVLAVFLRISKENNSDQGFYKEGYNVETKEIDRVQSLLEISVATVVCSKGNNTGPREEAVVMLKSVIISSFLYGVGKLRLHLFLEHQEDAYYFASFVKVDNDKLIARIFGNLAVPEIKMHIHSALAAVPERYHINMIYHPKFRCTYVRIFLPNALLTTDTVLYLDTDVIVTGSIVDLWNNFNNMSKSELIAIARNNEPTNPYYQEAYEKWFADIPHPPPKGLNAGVLLMNLTRMRNHGWVGKVLKTFDEYSTNYILNDQRLLNIYLRLNDGLFYTLPCQFNFRFTHCDMGLFCKEAEEDAKGVQVIHGAANMFYEGKSFRQIFLAYEKMNEVLGRQEFLENLAVPLKKEYDIVSSNKVIVTGHEARWYSLCFGTLDKILFKKL